jgi:hypothetical protein
MESPGVDRSGPFSGVQPAALATGKPHFLSHSGRFAPGFLTIAAPSPSVTSSIPFATSAAKSRLPSRSEHGAFATRHLDRLGPRHHGARLRAGRMWHRTLRPLAWGLSARRRRQPHDRYGALLRVFDALFRRHSGTTTWEVGYPATVQNRAIQYGVRSAEPDRPYQRAAFHPAERGNPRRRGAHAVDADLQRIRQLLR